jgi:DNA primase
MGRAFCQCGFKMNKIAKYPEHPNQLVTKKNEFYTSGIKEIDVYNYYEGIKNKLIPELKGRDLFIVMALHPGSEMYIRHPYNKKTEFIRINNEKQFEEYHTGKTGEFHITCDAITDEVVFDFDPGPTTDLKQVKEVVKLGIEFIEKQKDFKKGTEIRFTGSRGFHVTVFLKTKKKIADIKNDIETRLKEYFKDNENIVIAHNKPPKDTINIDLSPMKVNGGHIAPYSLRIKTGLICLPIKSIDSFEKDDAKLEKVYKKLIDKNFKWNNIKKGCFLVLQKLNKYGRMEF